MMFFVNSVVLNLKVFRFTESLELNNKMHASQIYVLDRATNFHTLKILILPEYRLMNIGVQ